MGCQHCQQRIERDTYVTAEVWLHVRSGDFRCVGSDVHVATPPIRP